MHLKFVVVDWDAARPSVFFKNMKVHQSRPSFFGAVDLDEEGARSGTITYDPAFEVPGRDDSSLVTLEVTDPAPLNDDLLDQILSDIVEVSKGGNRSPVFRGRRVAERS